MVVPNKILELTERFERNRDAYRSSDYNEAQARHEFIDPFFIALGWDVNNEKGYAEGYKEVIHEDAIKVGGATKAPDYAFRIGGVRKFFVEAKRPGLNIKEDGDAAYQLRRYAWSAKLPLSILTDFEEFAVYDCRIKPVKTDKASTGRVLYLTADEYAEQWDEIASIFSQDAILTGSFDKYAESTKKKKGTAEVDKAFLKEIEDWRDVLARNIALRNTELSTRELNFAVQRTIDRLIFLRICEDRGIETYGQLMALQNGTQIYKQLCQIFRRADERYNSGLFHFQKEKDRPEPPDGLTLNLTIDDKTLKGILKELYYPESPYEFSVLPADILGQVYEQFLGKVIRLTAGHRAVVEDKPEVKKAGGVYYTPTYIVDYIVKNTVGKLIEGKTPRQVNTLRILDPACGSGSFLLGAYQTLLDWHLKWYSEHDPEKHAKGRQPKIFHGPGGDWRLTTSEKKRILLNNIYGVDIDPQAVEVTKLSLLLKVLEGENEETIGQSLRLFHERALPDLADNIKCGNSLIGPDFYEGKQLSLIDEEERYRINAFDWNAEFPKIMAAGGFDAAIGNPPWVTMRGKQWMGVSDRVVRYYLSTYTKSAEYKINSFAMLLEKGLDLLRGEGRLAYIIPSTILTNQYLSKIRQALVQNTFIDAIVDLGSNVFRKGVADSVILSIQKEAKANSRLRALTDVGDLSRGHYIERRIRQKEFDDGSEFVFDLRLTSQERLVIKKIESQSIRLQDLLRVYVGIVTGDNRKYLSNRKVDEQYKRILVGANIGRYRYSFRGKYVLFDKARLHSNTNEKVYQSKEKIILRKTGSTITAALDTEQYFTEQTVYNLYQPFRSEIDLRYLLGAINSRLVQFYFSKKLVTNPQAYPYIKGIHVKSIPIHTIALSDSDHRKTHTQMAELVDTMLKLHKDLQTAKTDHEKSLIQRQIDATDKQIDQLVYELYGLTHEEIRIVEEATRG